MQLSNLLKGIWLEKRDSHKEVFIWLDDDLPLGSFLNTVRDILDDLYLPDSWLTASGC